MPSSTRRPHRKSRHGCKQCKQNRTKCDEVRPVCGRCRRTGATCSLLDPSSALIIIDNGSTAKAQRSDVSKKSPVSPPASREASVVSPIEVKTTQTIQNIIQSSSVDTNLNLSNSEVQRLRLLSHYDHSTAYSIGELTTGTQEGRVMWFSSITELAFKYDYLLHGLLSISALHLALDENEPESQRTHNGILAAQHYNHGIALYHPHLSNITASNVDALFAFACLTALYSFGIHLRRNFQLTPLVKIHEVFTMIRGTGIIVHSGMQWLQQGIWSPWFQPVNKNLMSDLLPAEIEDVLTRLTGRISSTITTSTQSEMYHTTIEALRKNFFQAGRRPRNQMALVVVPVLAPPEFLQMVCIGEPLALAILANWAVILYWFRRHVWLQNWGQQTVTAVREVLPPQWHDCIDWAVKEVEGSGDGFALPTPLSSSSISGIFVEEKDQVPFTSPEEGGQIHDQGQSQNQDVNANANADVLSSDTGNGNGNGTSIRCYPFTGNNHPGSSMDF